MGKAGNNYSSQETTLYICSCGTSAPQKIHSWPDIGKDFSQFPWEALEMLSPWPLLCVWRADNSGSRQLLGKVSIYQIHFSQSFFSLWTGHKDLSTGVRSGKGMVGAGSSPHAGLLQPGMENRLGCMHSYSHYDYRAHAIFLLHVLFTAGWPLHHHSTAKVSDFSQRH